MKRRILVILGIFIIILLFIAYLLYNYNKGIIQSQSFNKEYEQFYNKTILGIDLASLITKSMDYNERNNIDKDDKDRYYIETDNSILIEVKFSEKEKSVRMEDILNQGIENFNKYYKAANFKCTKIEYHEENKKVKSLYFEQVFNIG